MLHVPSQVDITDALFRLPLHAARTTTLPSQYVTRVLLDDMIIECAVNGHAEVIVTFNTPICNRRMIALVSSCSHQQRS